MLAIEVFEVWPQMLIGLPALLQLQLLDVLGLHAGRFVEDRQFPFRGEQFIRRGKVQVDRLAGSERLGLLFQLAAGETAFAL